MRVTLTAPLSGSVVPIDQVPDPVFAQKMVGDGVSIDPISEALLAPCDGRIVQLHSAGHAVTVVTTEGIEIMMHIGLDTVQLKGQGFTPRVRAGDTVKTGDVLIEFDADYVATHARSLLTQVIVTNMERVASVRPTRGNVVAGQDAIADITLAGADVAASTAAPTRVTSDPISVANVSGLHARPAAVLVQHAKRFTSDVRLRRGPTEVNAKSVVAILALEVNAGDTVQIVASGADAADAVATLSRTIGAGLGETAADTDPSRTSGSSRALSRDDEAPGRSAKPRGISRPVAPLSRSVDGDPNVLLGMAAAPGLAVGNVVQVRHQRLRVVVDANDPRQERRALDAALDHAKAELDALQARLRADGAGDKAAIFAAHRELLDDPDLLEIAGAAIDAGKSAAYGWQSAFTTHADRLADLKNELLAARANDLRDVGSRVLRHLTGVVIEAPQYPADAILIAEDLTPSDTANLDRAKVVGLCTTTGGATSHVAILARSLDIPLVAGIDTRALDVRDGTPVILDGLHGSLRLNPSTADIAGLHRQQEQHATRRRKEQQHAHDAAVTLDEHRVEIAANIGGPGEAEQAVALGAEGVGLLRSEFLFLHRTTAPDEAEQTQAYTEVARALGPTRRVVIRALDVGGDKPLPYVPIAREDNPFLGERGIRVLLDHPDLFRTQVRAILRAAKAGRVALMFPMIATLDEWRSARAVVDEERDAIGSAPIEIGIMMEVASAAIMADQFAREVDFFSIGTNDLTQYTLAIDRGHPRLAPQADGLSPAVLRLIARTVDAAHAHAKHVAVCGGIASDAQAVPILVGLGVDELSVSVPVIPSIKAQVRQLRLADCRSLATAALDCASASEVRALVPAIASDEV